MRARNHRATTLRHDRRTSKDALLPQESEYRLSSQRLGQPAVRQVNGGRRSELPPAIPFSPGMQRLLRELQGIDTLGPYPPG